MECPGDMTYKSEASQCTATCTDPYAEENCELDTAPGCECPGNKVLQGNTCINVGSCKCEPGDGNSYEVSFLLLSILLLVFTIFFF